MVKATFKGKREPMELEGDMILGATIQEDAIGNSEAFIIGDVKRSILPGALAVEQAQNAVTQLEYAHDMQIYQFENTELLSSGTTGKTSA